MNVPEPTSFVFAALAGMTLGLLSTPHCFGMCGPLHLAVCLAGDKHRFRTLTRFNLGRLVGYTLAGAACGFMGDVLADFFPKPCCHAGRRKLLMYLLPGITLLIIAAVGFLKKPVKADGKENWTIRLFRKAQNYGPIPCGLAATALPCGVLYAAFALAVSTSSPLLGAVLLFCYCFSLTFFLQLGIMAGTAVGQKLGPIVNRVFPWLALAGGLAYVLLFFRQGNHGASG